jgi:glutamine amidotransferase
VIAIVNYGSGNVQAVANIYGRLGIPFVLASNADDLAMADRFILPGVGSFDQVVSELNSSGMRQPLESYVVGEGRPILGICVGMQLLSKRSDEGSLAGLGWIDAQIKRLDHSADGSILSLPHMGWNTALASRQDPLLEGIDLRAGFYFLHSYYFDCSQPSDQLATTDYGREFTCIVRRGNIMGVQFHPEKSHRSGIQLLENYATRVL